MPDVTLAVELLLIALAVALVTQRTRRPYTIALVIWGLILGLLQLVEPAHLSKELILTIFLPPLLFEGALHIRAGVLRRRAGLVLGLALGGTLLTAAAVGAAAHWMLGLDWLTGLLLGTIVAPTDPVSVLATFRAARVERDLSTVVESESLFNDGIAVVLYLILLKALNGASLNPLSEIGSFGLVVGGGVAVGLGLGFLTAQMLARIEDHLVQVMTTLILVYGAFVLAEHLHLSGVIAVAVTGLVVGNAGLREEASRSRANVTLFWEIVAFLVNSAVFLLIGLALHPERLIGDLASIVVAVAVLLAARALAVYGLGALVHRRSSVPRKWRHVIFWGGLRGAVPVALALGLPSALPRHDELVAIVFGVVLFSLLGQGLTMPALLHRLGLVRDEAMLEMG